MPDNAPPRPTSLRLTICAAVLLATSGYLAWTAFAYAEGGYITSAVLMVPTAIGVFLHRLWAQHFAFFFAATWNVVWLVETPSYLRDHWPDVNPISVIISLIPLAFILIVSWQVFRGFRNLASAPRASSPSVPAVGNSA